MRVTENENLGMVPDCATLGNFVAVLDGVRRPVILMPLHDRFDGVLPFVFVGDHFYDGVSTDSGSHFENYPTHALDITLR